MRTLCYTTAMESDGDSRELLPAKSGPLPTHETRRADRMMLVPAIVAAGGDNAMRRFLEFFAVTIDNKNTRDAYLHACRRFFAWCEPHEEIEELAEGPLY